MDFGLRSDVIFICEQRQQSNDLKVDVHRWCASAARFVRDTETVDRLKVIDVDRPFRCIYVDDKYLIIDFDNRMDNSRLIKVFSLETMQLLRERNFYRDLSGRNAIWNEYHDGGIVVWTLPTDGQPSCVALWDVDKNTVQPITDHPNEFLCSFTMTHHPFQIVVEVRGNHAQLLLFQRGQPTRNSVFDMPLDWWGPLDGISSTSWYFDGVQMITQSIDEFNEVYEIMMADLVG